MQPSENPKTTSEQAVRKAIRSVRTATYKKSEARLPKHVFETSCEKFKLFLSNPEDPLLGIHQLHGRHADKMAACVNGEYRAVFRIEDTERMRTYVWLWVGNHSEYEDRYE